MPAPAKSPGLDIEALLGAMPLFKGLAPALLTRIREAGRLRTYAKGEMIFCHGDEAGFYYILLEGWVKVFRETMDGKESVAALLTRNDAFGEAAFFGSAVYPFSAEAVEESTLVCVDAVLLREHLRNDSTLAMNLLETISRHKHMLEMQLEHMAMMNAPQRIGCFFLRLCSSGAGPSEFTLPVDKSLLAAHLGMKPETFSRALAQLKEEVGVSTKGSKVSVADVARLEEFTCVSCSDDGECAKP